MVQIILPPFTPLATFHFPRISSTSMLCSMVDTSAIGTRMSEPILLIWVIPMKVTRSQTEIWLHYYDILARHAFGNYLDLLREVTFSPLMGDPAARGGAAWRCQQTCRLAHPKMRRLSTKSMSPDRLGCSKSPLHGNDFHSYLCPTTDDELFVNPIAAVAGLLSSGFS